MNTSELQKAFIAFFFHLTSGQAIGRPETGVLCSFGSRYNRSVPPRYTLPDAFELCDSRVWHMREHGLPCDAFCICWYPSGGSCFFPDCTVFTGIQPTKFSNQETREAVIGTVKQGLVFCVPNHNPAQVPVTAADPETLAVKHRTIF